MVRAFTSCRLSGWLMVVAMLPLLMLAGCDTGSRSGSDGGIIVDPVDCDGDAIPFLLEASASEGCAGDVLTLSGLNFSSVLDGNVVAFTDNTGVFRAQGRVISFVDNGEHPEFPGCLATDIQVIVPGGVRSGLVSLDVIGPLGLVAAGVATFTACPGIVGFGVGADAEPYLGYAPALTTWDDVNLSIYGYNLNTVTECIVEDSSGNQTNGFSVTPGGASSGLLPAGMSMVTIDLDPSVMEVQGNCTTESDYIRVKLVSNATGTTLESSTITVPYRIRFFVEPLETLRGSITAVIVPSGLRRGSIPIKFQLTMEPANSSYDVLPEWFDAATSSWSPCTPVDAEMGLELATGAAIEPSSLDLLGGGASHTFLWDSAADIVGPPTTTRVRLPVDNPQPTDNVCFLQVEPWESEPILVSNPVDPGGTLIELSGAVVEDFGGNVHEDITFGTALWNGTSSGNLTGGLSPGELWSSGTVDVELVSGGSYEMDLANGIISDLTEVGNPQTILSSAANPGANQGEFHVRTFVWREGALVTAFGSGPLVIRASGTGIPMDTVVLLDAAIGLDGQDGLAATGGGSPAAGLGGFGSLGGGDGGDGGFIDVQPTGQIVSVAPSQSGGNDGGERGADLTVLRPSGFSNPRAAAGGGGGCRVPGEDGEFTGSTQHSRPGVGGPARGGPRLLAIVGGSGGGGGGGMIVRATSASPASSKPGGGGGGGGGALLVVANGSIDVSSSITANGGDGAVGSHPSAGPGGGGSGGTIRFSASGDIRLFDTTRIDAIGGSGAEHPTGTPQLHGGDGADGIIRLEAGGAINFPSQGEFSQVIPGIGTDGMSAGVSSLGSLIDGGNGADGVLNLSAATGVVTADTDLGEVRDASGALLLTRTADPIAFNLSSLVVPVGVTLRGVGTLPLVMRVNGDALVDGTVDVSGFAGGEPDVSTDPASPTAGFGGAPGAGGGAGGSGGVVNTDLTFTLGGDSDLSFLPAEAISSGGGSGIGSAGGGSVPVPLPLAEAATAGTNSAGSGVVAGAGGSGSHNLPGFDGATVASSGDGLGGLPYGSDFFLNVITGELLLVGGMGGAGGGASPESFAGSTFDTAPGTGGGGGGGMFYLAVNGNLQVGVSAMFVARGGDASQAPINGGNAGAGAGGGIYILGNGVVDFFGGVDVSGGQANLSPASGTYTGNALTSAGDGSSGRFRVESPLGFVGVGDLGVNPAPSLGSFRGAVSNLSQARSEPYELATGGARSGRSMLGVPTIELAPPFDPAANVDVVYEGAAERNGQPGPFVGQVDDPSLLPANVEFIRMTFFLWSSKSTSVPGQLDRIEVPFSF